MHARPTRRAVLGAALLAGATACLPRGRRRAAPDADAGALAAAVRAERELLELYARASVPASLAGAVAAARGDHAAHLAALGGGTATPSAGPTPGGSVGAADLEAAERAHARRCAAAALSAQAPAKARLLASVAASEAAHADVLRAAT